MSTIHLHQTTTATPEQFLAGLTGFGPGRAELFPNSADDYLKVHSQGPNQADVIEGSGGVWERLHYDWSDPNRVVLTTTESPRSSRSPAYRCSTPRRTHLGSTSEPTTASTVRLLDRSAVLDDPPSNLLRVAARRGVRGARLAHLDRLRRPRPYGLDRPSRRGRGRAARAH
jgi:hypothetical protein